MPLDDVDVDNGCMWFLPGSHRGGVLPHRHVGDDPAVHLLELVDAVDTTAAVPIEMRAGAVASTTRARSTRHVPNPTDRPRRAWANEFQSAPIALDVPADRPWVTEGFQAMTDALVEPPVIDPAANPAVVDPSLDSRGDHVREPDRRARARAAPRTAAARARRTAACSRASGSCSPTSRDPASSATSG